MVATISSDASDEMFQYWRQLGLAGLIEGNYTGLNGSGFGTVTSAGANVPRSKTNAQWRVQRMGVSAGDGSHYAADYGNNYVLEAAGSTEGPIMKPEELWNIDTKLDDGKPATGRIMPDFWQQCSTSASATDRTGAYKLSSSSFDCLPFFLRQF